MPSNDAPAIDAGEWLVSPGTRYAPYSRWSCWDCHVIGRIRPDRDQARDEAAGHVKATGHTVTVTHASEETLHGMALR